MKTFLLLAILLDLTGPIKPQSQPQSQKAPTIHHERPKPPPVKTPPPTPVNEPSDLDLVKFAYVYGFPLVLMDLAEKSMALKVNQFLPEGEYAWLDLTYGPVILETNGTNNLQLIDGWAKVITTFDQSHAEKKIAITSDVGEIPAGYDNINLTTKFALLKGTHDNVKLYPLNPQKSPIIQISTLNGVGFFNRLIALTRLTKYDKILTMHTDILNQGAEEAFAIIKSWSENQDPNQKLDENSELARAVRAYSLFLSIP